ncbi:MAG: pseudouridylate synthase [Actinomycetales bacterium]|nr:MAG: pseudouridylate synthase [Actinomycetales bacterium]
MPQAGPWTRLRDHLVDRLPLPAQQIDELLAAGEFAGPDGMPVAPDAPFVPRSVVWVHRPFPDEVPVPFDVPVLYRDERIVVVDKPHFLATMPRGRHIRETVLARMRVALGLPRLAPAHRLDRLTAGVLLLTTEQRWRGPYQQVFADGAAEKHYLACAPVRPELATPTTLRVHLDKPHGQLQARVVPEAPPNSCTEIHLLDHRADLGLYALRPHTGRTHQLRAQLNWLGIPIHADPLYPVVRDVPDTDFSDPLGLVATALLFRDPIDGKRHELRSSRIPPPWDSPIR